jgi:hypothetical protein
MKGRNKIAAALAVIIIIILIGASYFYMFYEAPTETEEDEAEDEDGLIVDDRISPLVEQAVGLEITRIRKKGLEPIIRRIGNSWKDKPNYYFKATMDTGLWTGHKIHEWDTEYVGWEAYRFVDEEQEKCKVKIEMWETRPAGLLGMKTQEVFIEGIEMTYNFKTGRWYGDDNFGDKDGYGHYDGNTYEIWFNIRNSDYDNDAIPYWTEVNILGTDPKIDDRIQDPDEDGIPTAWEWKWGWDPDLETWIWDPFIADNHSEIDPEVDGLSNLVEYEYRKYTLDPYYQEILIECDFMDPEPGLFGHEHIFWEESQTLLMDEFNERDISVHIDDGAMGEGGEFLEYYPDYIDQASGLGSEYYKYHFADDRKGVFHYMFVCHKAGWNHPQDSGQRYDTLSVPSNNDFYKKVFRPKARTPRLQRIAMTVGAMHELGHSLGLMPERVTEGIDNATQVGRNNLPLLQKLRAQRDAIEYWDNYESCMNYAKFSELVLGYSDGNNGERDADDWSYVDLTYFQRPSLDSLEGIEWDIEESGIIPIGLLQDLLNLF